MAKWKEEVFSELKESTDSKDFNRLKTLYQFLEEKEYSPKIRELQTFTKFHVVTIVLGGTHTDMGTTQQYFFERGANSMTLEKDKKVILHVHLFKKNSPE